MMDRWLFAMKVVNFRKQARINWSRRCTRYWRTNCPIFFKHFPVSFAPWAASVKVGLKSSCKLLWRILGKKYRKTAKNVQNTTVLKDVRELKVIFPIGNECYPLRGFFRSVVVLICVRAPRGYFSCSFQSFSNLFTFQILHLNRKACEAWKILLKRKYLEQRLIDNRSIWQLLTMKSVWFMLQYIPSISLFYYSKLNSTKRVILQGWLSLVKATSREGSQNVTRICFSLKPLIFCSR